MCVPVYKYFHMSSGAYNIQKKALGPVDRGYSFIPSHSVPNKSHRNYIICNTV